MINELKVETVNKFTSLAYLTLERISLLEEEMLESHDKYHCQNKSEAVMMVMISEKI
jgi:hypothetical protein